MKDNIYIERIIKYAQKITHYMVGINTFEEFSSKDEKIDAVILNLEQIGETAKKISMETKMNYPNIHWPGITGLRNIISHEYEGIRLLIIYEIASINIEELLKNLKR
jgi:uncharacterized protein with HEPN domain